MQLRGWKFWNKLWPYLVKGRTQTRLTARNIRAHSGSTKLKSSSFVNTGCLALHASSRRAIMACLLQHRAADNNLIHIQSRDENPVWLVRVGSDFEIGTFVGIFNIGTRWDKHYGEQVFKRNSAWRRNFTLHWAIQVVHKANQLIFQLSLLNVPSIEPAVEPSNELSNKTFIILGLSLQTSIF